MNPLPLVLAELRRNPLGCAAIAGLIAIAVALGVALSAHERALRLASARASEALWSMHAKVGNEALTGLSLHAVLGNVHDLLRAMTFAFDGLLVTAVLLVIVAVLSTRRQSVGALRALGASPVFVFVTVWLQGALLIAAGVVCGLGLGFVLAKAMRAFAAAELGFDIDATIGVPELAFAGALLAAGSLFAAAPSLPLFRLPAAHLMRSA